MNQAKNYKILIWLSIVLIPSLLAIFIVLYKIDVNVYKELTHEDNILEWLTFWLLFLTGLVSLIIAIRMRKGDRHFFWFFLILSIACILASFEEISWGQRIFNVKSPDFFLENSDQKEINIHNVLQEWGKDLPILGITRGFKTKHLVGFVLITYGTILPILSLNNKVSNFFYKIHFVVPPIFLSVSFLLAGLLMADKPTGREEEIGECFLSICLFLFIMLKYIQYKDQR